MLSKTEQNHINEVNSLLKGLVFSKQKVCENGIFDKTDVVQTLDIKNYINQTEYPYRKYYDIKIKRRYLSLPSKYYKEYNFYVYVDDEERITELTPLIIYNCDGMHERRQPSTKNDYVDIVYRLFRGNE